MTGIQDQLISETQQDASRIYELAITKVDQENGRNYAKTNPHLTASVVDLFLTVYRIKAEQNLKITATK